uniref:PH domain-containing protein n=1 Tax=Setaria digitata TaxID=48799 RepID=A0A915Q2V7_9BILA
METEDADLARIIQRTKERELLIEKENTLLGCRSEISAIKGDTESVTPRPLLNRNKERIIDSLYPTEELETMKRISLDSPRNPNSDSLHDGDTADRSCNAKLRARFAALAADVENFECDIKPTRSKESFLRGPSPRLSSGDISPAVLFTPTVSYYPPSLINKLSTDSLPLVDEKKSVPTLNDDTLTFADESFDKNDEHKTTVTTDYNEPTDSLKSSSLVCNTSEKRLRFATPVYELAETDPFSKKCSSITDSLTDGYPTKAKSSKDLVNDKKLSECDTDNGSESEKYGIHKFFKRKVPEEPSEFSRDVSFIYLVETYFLYTVLENGLLPLQDDSNCDKRNHNELERDKRTFSVSRNDIIDEITATANRASEIIFDKPTHTKQIAKQLDKKIREENLKAKVVPKVDASFSKLGHHLQSKKELSYAEIDTRSANVKSLRDRWEVSSATGTPLHPDQEEDDLLQAAIRMAKSLKQGRIRIRPQSYSETKSSVQSSDFRPISATSSTSYIPFTGSIQQEQLFEAEEKRDAAQDDKVNVVGKSSTETNQLIDDAFQFIHRTPDKNSSLMSAILSTPEIRTTLSPSNVAATSHENTKADASLAHSVSFYRKKEKENRSAVETVMLGQFIPSPFSNTANLAYSVSKANINERTNFEIDRARLEKAINVQQEQIVQASRALSFCHSTQEFRGSREEVDAQRALLIATERRRALIFVLDRLIQKHAAGGVQHTISDGPRGNLTFSDISVKLMRDFVNGHINYHDDHLLFYFIILIRHEETVHHTTLTTSDEGICSGRLEFPHYIQFRSLPHDFICTLEIFALRTRRELLRHETKYHIKGGNSLKKSQKSMLSPGLVSLGGPSAVIDPSFQRVGYLSLNIGSVNKTRFHLSDTLYPLDGIVEMKVRCYAEDCGTVGYKGFLSLYQPVENIASWARFWCVLWDGQLRFWRYPEDESTKIPVVSIDLRTCACNEIKPIPVERCPYPNSMQIDVWLPSKNPQKPDRIRILMAADRKDEMHSWLNAMNISLRNLTLWSCRS